MRHLKFLRRIGARPFLGADTTASCTEQTGLAPTVPANESQAEAYAALMPIHAQKPKREA